MSYSIWILVYIGIIILILDIYDASCDGCVTRVKCSAKVLF